MSDWWNQPMRSMGGPQATTDAPPLSCPWCDAPTLPDASNCPNCGAVMVQHEDLGGLVIPGVAVVDPAM